MGKSTNGVSWGRSKNFWIRQAESHNITVADVAEKLNVHLLTAKAYFTGFCKPTPYTNKILCEWMDVDYNTGMQEFEKAYEAWGKAHPNYVPYYSTYKTARGVTLQKARDRTRASARRAPTGPVVQAPVAVAADLPEVSQDPAPAPISKPRVSDTSEMLKVLYGKLTPYSAYLEAIKIKDQNQLLLFAYGKVDYATFVTLHQIYLN